MSGAAYLPRHVDRALAAALSTFPIVVLDGPRAVGKTTTAQRVAASTLEFPVDLERVDGDAGRLLGQLEPPVLIDEWQLAGTDLLWALKRIVDDDPKPGRFVLTGSVEPATYGPTYPLTGRAVRIMMRPMSAAERAGRGESSTFLQQWIEGALPTPTSGQGSAFEIDEMFTAGFPAARSLPDATLFLEGYAALVAQRAGDEGRDASRLLTTMRVLATLESQAVPDQRIWESADINKATWKAYDDLLMRTHLAVPSSAFQSNRLKRLTSYPKRHLADVALALALGGVDRTRLVADRTLAGRYVESYVMQKLRPQVDLSGGELSHLRTGAGGREIDAIIEFGTSIHAIEVKHHGRVTRADAAQLAWLRDELGDRFASGLVVHTGSDVYELGDRLWGVPVTQL